MAKRARNSLWTSSGKAEHLNILYNHSVYWNQEIGLHLHGEAEPKPCPVSGRACRNACSWWSLSLSKRHLAPAFLVKTEGGGRNGDGRPAR